MPFVAGGCQDSKVISAQEAIVHGKILVQMFKLVRKGIYIKEGGYDTTCCEN